MQKFIFTLIFLSNIVFAIEKVFIREYTYKASDYDSKVTARVNALNQVSELLLREVGVYIKSETKWDKKEINYEIEEIYEKKMDVITAGITKIEVIDEKWTGIEYWVKAKVKLNPKNVLKQIDALVNNKEKFDQYEHLEKENNKANKEIERLRKELANVKSKNEQLELSKSYNKEVDKLSAQEWLKKGNYEISYGNTEKAKSFFITAIELYPDFSLAYNNLGFIYNEEGNYDQAITSYLKSIELSPKMKMPYYNLGIIYSFRDMESDQAEIYFLKAIELDSEFAEAYSAIAMHYTGQGKYDQAEINYKKAIEIGYNSSQGYSNIEKKTETYTGYGILLYLQEKYDEAERIFLKVIKLNSKYSKAYYLLGFTYYKKGDKEKGLKNYKKAAKLGHQGSQEWLKDNGYTW